MLGSTASEEQVLPALRDTLYHSDGSFKGPLLLGPAGHIGFIGGRIDLLHALNCLFLLIYPLS